ncbi:beta family protein [Saccharopolyspora dendranthemae]|uniref:T4 beta protein n=1 Tax=Saccharopolyspora dendranthemae TaxID=1181886 RepID=A0A561V7P2_9PSEU|nr:hypothetical protein [Saccharopolyspora dendranthemae]TWG07639.1 T4 beta protein [Saccharopolyspora dendranthemae]
MAQDFSALVALRAKRGELTALRRWNRTSQIRRVQPLLELVPGSSPHSQLGKVDEVARSLHAAGRHLMIDATEVAHMPSFGSGPAGALRTLADRLDGPVDLLDSYPVPFEPVIRSDVEADVLSACRNLSEEMGLGGAIRMRPAEFTRARLSELLERTRLDNAELDLIIDLQYVPENSPRLQELAGKALRIVAEFGPFRSTTLLAGSIPRMLNRTSTWEEPRVEEELWRQLRDETAVDVQLGDYGVVHPIPGKGYRSKHVSLKYSCNKSWMYSREPTGQTPEDATESVRASTLRSICRELVHSGRFSGPEFSWGDEEIAAAFNNDTSAWGATSRPVALGTSHHLAYLANTSEAMPR